MIEQDFLGQYTPSTYRTYGQVLAEFNEFTGHPAHEATQADMSAYYRDIQHQSSATVHKKLATLRSYMTYLTKRGVRSDNPMIAIRMPRVDRLRSVKYLSGEEATTLINRYDCTTKDRRDTMMIWLFLHGLRLSELINLNVEDYREGNLWVTGKGDKTRIIPVMRPAQIMLEEHLGNRRTGPMFVGVYGGERIGRRQVQYAIKARTGVHPHALRHTAGTLMMRATGNLAAVQEVLGHANPATTRIYAQLDVSDLREAMEETMSTLGWSNDE